MIAGPPADVAVPDAVRLRWAARYLPVPELLGSGSEESSSWLVTRDSRP
jgi:aminoglycoside phosphotransferase